MEKTISKFIIILIIAISFIISCNNVKAAQNTFSILDESNYSMEYKKWLELPENERQNYIMPMMYTVDLDTKFLEDNQAKASNLSSKYNLKDNLSITVRNQQNTTFCWAFASSKVFETTQAKINNKTILNTYSPRHMVYATSRYFLNNVENSTGFNKDVQEGGNYLQALAYYTSGKGPVLESDMPFVNSMDRINISEIQNKKIQAQVEKASIYPSIYKSYDSYGNVTYSNGAETTYSKSSVKDFRDIIKSHIMQYGGISTMTYSPTSMEDFYYSNDLNSYYCNNTGLVANHAVIIVGWDDNYSKDNFKDANKPANDGAYIALNSYGSDFNSKGGYYYISYDDYFVELNMFGIQGISDIDYDNIYQYDELGMIYFIYNQSSVNNVYAANVFKKKSNSIEKLSEIGLYMYTTNDVTIYVNASGDNLNINNLQPVATAINLEQGYHTIKLNTPIIIGNTFSVIVKYSNKDLATIPVEMKLEELTDFWNTSTANCGESFISGDGINWTDATMVYDSANVCIKAFTTYSTSSGNTSSYIKNSNWSIITKSNVKMLTGINENTSISQLLSSSNYTSGYTAKAYKNNVEVTSGNTTTGTVIKIYSGSNVVDEYAVVIYGDTTGDGSILSLDALVITKNKLDTEKFKNLIFEQAGRVTVNTRNSNSTPSAVDALAVVKYKLGTGTISQY